jgi:hypothetical protein
MLDLFECVPDIPSVRPEYNIGGGFDIVGGEYHIGDNNQTILNGGLSITQSIAAAPNAFKTAVAIFMNLSVSARYAPFKFSIYETEGALTNRRVDNMITRFPNLQTSDTKNAKYQITCSADDILGDVYFQRIKQFGKDKAKDKQNYMTTPFIDFKTDKYIKVVYPTGCLIDSFSNFEISSVYDNIIDKNNIGDSGSNVYAMKSAGAKKQMLMQLPNLATSCGLFFTFTAHLGSTIVMSEYAPRPPKLALTKANTKVKDVTEAFSFNMNKGYEIQDIGFLKASDKSVLYPLTDRDRDPKCTDLLYAEMTVTRNKRGSSGGIIGLVISQREGILPHLSSFHNIKLWKYGIGGNDQNYFLHLLPEVKLSRTTVRQKIDENYTLRRALEITQEMLQMTQFWNPLTDDLMCTPEQLYTDLKAVGLDWEVLLNTRGYWVFKEHEKDEQYPELSTMDLLRLRKKLYSIYWKK